MITIDPDLGCQLGHSLPPQVAGRVSGEVELRLSKVVLVDDLQSTTNINSSSSSDVSNFLKKSHTVDIRCRWWGDPGAGSLFTPRVFRSDADEGLLPVTPANRIVFPLHSRWDRMRSYFSDAQMDGVLFDVIDPATHLVTGCAHFDTSILDVDIDASTTSTSRGGGAAAVVPLSLSRSVPIRLPPSDVEQGGEIVGHLHLKVIVRTGRLSIVKEILEGAVRKNHHEY
jgi:hypothetical protein